MEIIARLLGFGRSEVSARELQRRRRVRREALRAALSEGPKQPVPATVLAATARVVVEERAQA